MSNNITEYLNHLVSINAQKEQGSSFLFYFKLFSSLIVAIITFSFGLLPLFFANFRQGTVILNYANPFSGGIFIGIGLFHLLPEASYNFEQYYKTQEGKSSFFYGFPMSYFIVFLSYSFILYLEKVAFSSKEIESKDNDLLSDKGLDEPLLNKKNEINEKDNIENIEINDEKLMSPLFYKRNIGK
jgi:hypothetical protein